MKLYISQKSFLLFKAVWGLKFLALFQKMCYIEYTDRDSHRSGYSQQLKYNLHHAVTIAVDLTQSK